LKVRSRPIIHETQRPGGERPRSILGEAKLRPIFNAITRKHIMGIFSRVKDIALSNVHAALDGVDDPMKTTKLIIRGTEDELVRLRRAASMAASDSRRCERELTALMVEISDLETQAATAVANGHEPLARLALRNKLALQTRISGMQSELSQSRRTHNIAAATIQELDLTLSDARNRQRAITHALAAPAAQVTSRKGRDQIEHSLTRLDTASRLLSDLEVDLGMPEQKLRDELRELQVEADIDAALKKMAAKKIPAAE
jgi:phage shock protein A